MVGGPSTSLGALEVLPRLGDRFDWRIYRERKALQDLFVPSGMGESHQVLVLGTRGMESDLTGLRAPERWNAPPGDGPGQGHPSPGA